MKDWTVAVALSVGASIAVACMVYDPSDLTGEGWQGGAGGAGSGGLGGGLGGDSPVAGSGGGAAGTAAGTGGSGAQAGHSGATDGGDGGEGEAGSSFGGDVNGGTSGTSGGVGGTGGTGATAGSAGSPPINTDPKLIEDCEWDHDNRIKRVQHPPGVFRNGFWYTGVVGEPYTELLPEPGTEFEMEPHTEAPPTPDQPNLYGFRLYAKQVSDGAVGNGAIAGFNFLEPKTAYDGSEYQGISFWARASKPTPIRFKIAIKGTDAKGGVCGNKCSDHYFIELPVTATWSKSEVLWGDVGFQQEGWGMPVPFEPKELMSVEFFVPAYATDPEVELWIDDVYFLE